MAKQVVEDDLWKSRLSAANRYYDQWSHLFKCDILEEYYEGFQWKSQKQIDFEPYTINKIFETLEIKIASFVPTFIKYLVTARPSNSDFNPELAFSSSTLKEDVLNTIVQDDKVNFHDEIEMAYKDSFFRFGMMEVGYAADWILNPAAPKPSLSQDIDKPGSNSKPYKVRYQPPELPVNERIYFKHIGAKRFRVGGIDNKYLPRCGWCGYYDWIDKNELLSMKIMNRDKVESAQAYTSGSEASKLTQDYDNGKYKVDALKLWHIWDIRNSLQLLILDSPCVTVFQRKFKRLPLFDLRPHRRLKTEGFYPIPPVFQWLSPQNEINEIRDQLRNHRRRFVRKYQFVEGTVDDEEIEKFETGPDGALVKVKRDNAIAAIDAPDLGQSMQMAEITSTDDLNQISGTSSEVRGVADRTTATQANIVNQRSSVREQKERDRFVAWLVKIGREVLLLTRDKFTIGTWTKLQSNPGEQFLGEVQENMAAYQWVTTEDLNDGYDFTIDVDVTSLSVAAQQDEKQKFLEFLSVTTQFPQIALSPKLIREAAYRVGYRNESVIREMQKMALLMQLGQMQQQQQQQQGPNGNQIAQGINAQQTPNSMEQIRNQMQNQLGVTQ